MKYSQSVKRKVTAWQVGLIGLSVFQSFLIAGVAQAGVPGSVMINEVAWAGSANSANDEWIELYNNTGAAVDLSGWKLRDDGVEVFTFPQGATASAYGYLLIERSEAATSVPADFIYSMSLANSGDSLQLIDAAGMVIDTVNGSGGAWYAGSSTTFSTMEKIDSSLGDMAGNFAASNGGGSATASGGAVIMGTPRSLNSVSAVPVSQPKIKGEIFPAQAQVGDIVVLKISAANLSDLFAYGFELNYDSSKLEYQSASALGFLGENGMVETSFQSGLKNDLSGSLLVAEARTIDPKVGRSGSGDLLQVNFKVLSGSSATVDFGQSSFASSPSNDLSVAYSPAVVSISSAVLPPQPVTGVAATEGAGRYQIKLSWVASLSSPDHYRVERKNARGEWIVLAGVSGTEFVDQDGVQGGGAIIPKLAYQYRISAVKGMSVSDPVEISAQDSRGVRGDNNRSDLVDGRDLENLAKHFSETDLTSVFNPLVDTTYDGQVNGSDLIDIGAAFAKKY